MNGPGTHLPLKTPQVWYLDQIRLPELIFRSLCGCFTQLLSFSCNFVSHPLLLLQFTKKVSLNYAYTYSANTILKTLSTIIIHCSLSDQTAKHCFLWETVFLFLMNKVAHKAGLFPCDLPGTQNNTPSLILKDCRAHEGLLMLSVFYLFFLIPF